MKRFFSCFHRQGGTSEQVRRKMVIVGDGECGKTCLLMRMKTGTFQDVGYLPTVFETEVIDVNTGNEQVELVVFDTAGQDDYDRLRPLSYNDVDVALICFSLAEPDSLANVVDRWSPEVKHFCGNVPIILVGNKKDLRDNPEVETASYIPAGTTKRTSRFEKSPQECTAPPTSTESVETSSHQITNSPECNVDPFSNVTPPVYVQAKPTFRRHVPVKHSEGSMMARRIGSVAYIETSALTGEYAEELLLATTKASILGHKKAKKFKPFTNTLKSWASGPLK